MKKKVLITGAYGGIGRALAEAYLKEDFVVVLVGRALQKLQALQKSLGPNSEIAQCDVADLDQCKALYEKYAQSIDVLINNAGVSYIQRLGEGFDVTQISRLADINYKGSTYLTQLFLEELEQRKGSVVVVSSVAGYAPVIGRAAYCASKFALEGFYKVLQAERPSLHVMMTYPTFVQTDIRKAATSNQTVNEVLSAEYVAQKMVQAQIKRKNRLFLGKTARLSYVLNKYFPGLYVHLMRKKVSLDG